MNKLYRFSPIKDEKTFEESLFYTAKELEKLRAEIRTHEHRYYVLDDPEISDFDFDQLMQRLQELEQQDG